MQNEKNNTIEKLKRSIPLIVVILLTIIMAVYYNKPEDGAVATSASKKMFIPAKVVEVVVDEAEADEWTEGLRLGYQFLHVQALAGDYKGDYFETENFMNAYYNIDVKEGDKILVYMDWDESGEPYIAAVYSYYRIPVIVGLVVLFCGLLIFLGRGKGIRALLGLTYTLGALWFILIPMLQKGWPTIPATILVIGITAVVTLILLTGYSKKTFCAVAGCLGGVLIAGFTASVAGSLTHMSGFNMPEAEDLILRAAEGGLTVKGLLVSGILISALGAVMDVAMSISSASSELVALNPGISREQVFKSGMNIGRDAMGTMANTLILAFTGASLNELILFRVFNYPLIQLLNTDMLLVEIIQGISGSIGILLTVPIVAFVSAYVMTSKNKK